MMNLKNALMVILVASTALNVSCGQNDSNSNDNANANVGTNLTPTTITNPDGSTTVQNVDGTTVTTRLDGTVVTRNLDGSTTTTDTAGNTVTRDVNGNVISNNNGQNSNVVNQFPTSGTFNQIPQQNNGLNTVFVNQNPGVNQILVNTNQYSQPIVQFATPTIVYQTTTFHLVPQMSVFGFQNFQTVYVNEFNQQIRVVGAYTAGNIVNCQVQYLTTPSVSQAVVLSNLNYRWTF